MSVTDKETRHAPKRMLNDSAHSTTLVEAALHAQRCQMLANTSTATGPPHITRQFAQQCGMTAFVATKILTGAPGEMRTWQKKKGTMNAPLLDSVSARVSSKRSDPVPVFLVCVEKKKISCTTLLTHDSQRDGVHSSVLLSFAGVSWRGEQTCVFTWVRVAWCGC